MKIAIVGAGISGLAAAWLLKQRHEVTLFEAGDYLGGHTHTVDVELAGERFPVDTGFLVFNHRTYPNLTALFRELAVDTVPSDMSFAVSLREPELEWAGSSVATLFAQKRNLARPGFWRMLQDTLRFNRETAGALPDLTLGAYLERQRYSAEFRDWYLLPMAAAIWSCPTQAMLDYPLTTFVRFARNHGLLQIVDRPQWLTVRGGGREYVERIAATLADVRLATRCARCCATPTASGWACPAANASASTRWCWPATASRRCALLGAAATPAERRVIGAVRYQPNRAVLHTDRRLLPRDERVWSAWNYLAGRGEPGSQPVSVSYLINQLQPLPVATPVVVTLNPHVEPDPQLVIGDFEYDHPIFDQAAVDAQASLGAIQGADRVWFCGAWGGYGFHEDGLNSALAVAERLGCHARWQAATTGLENAA
jgi:predicted NAD/FAD-binding protein